MLDELVKQALVGTGRAVPTPPRADGPLAEALQLAAGGAGPSPEARLLAAAAVLSRYEACGRTPSAPNASEAAAAAAVEPAPADAKPQCSRRAADLLGQLLGMSNTPAKQALLREWLDLAALARRRAPHHLLPTLLEYGASYRPLRQSVADAADARGAWLMGLNPRWRIFAGDVDGQQELPWDTGVTEQRIATLRRLRGSDPAAARRLVESTWKHDGADERARFVETMRVGLSADDEPFLEAALDDRSKQVRAAAVDVLARLPGSAFVDRMVRRAELLLKLTSATAGRRKGTSAALEVTLPPEKFDESWERDGITPKAEERMGQRQWRLMQVLSHVPPAHWSKSWNAAPAELVAAAAASEHRGLLLTAWTNAAVRNLDPEWAAALLRGPSGAQDDPRHRQGRQELLRSMRPTDRLSVLAEILESSTAAASFDAATAWIQAADFPLDRRAAAAAFALLERRVAVTNGYDYAVGHALEQLALVVPSDLHDELAARWTGAAWDQNRKALDRFFQTLGTRRDIQREFTT